MNFLSVSFAVFFIVILLVLSRITDVRIRNVILLAGNLLFYSLGDVRFLALLIGECALAYFGARKIGREKREGRTGTAYVRLTVALSAGALITAKTLPFAGVSIQPLGISFFTLMVISYLVDVYRGKMEDESDPVSVALYVSFFPQIVSGPITKARELMGQFREVRPVNKASMYSGMQIFLTGALKKVLIADRLAVCSDAVYSNPGMYSGLSVLLGTMCYTLQLYCDFSGYTDMAAGIATMMGFGLAKNFDLPYIAANPTEMWKRWHISLSSWLGEYIYIPLGGNRKGKARQYLNLILTMIVGGLWHGVAWTYVLWGIECGLGLCIHKVFLEWKGSHPVKGSRTLDIMGRIFTYFYFLAGTMIFRAASVGDALTIFKRIFTMAPGVEYYYVYFFIYLVLVGTAYAVAYIKNKGHGYYVNLNLDGFRERVLFLFVILSVIIYGYFGNNVFIYAGF